MRTILVSTSSRAERGLLDPVLIELERYSKEHPDLHLLTATFEFDYRNFITKNVLQLLHQKLQIIKPDIVLVPTDRWEQAIVAAFAFNNGCILAHFHAGDKGEGTTDEINRYAISLFSHIFFCNSKEARGNLTKFGVENWRIHVVGTTALDHIKVELPPEEIDNPYDLVVLHPDPFSSEATSNDLKETIIQVLRSPAPTIVWIEPNYDNNNELIRMFLKEEARHLRKNIVIYENLPRGQFLGLLKYCSRAIGNGSTFTCELPLLNPNVELISIGHRNQHRTKPSTKTGASKKIAETLATIPLNEKLRRKQCPI
jgi:GDP/UDP-N,N'-diacetylbacillosamine 2-epimerase (hydrolysing)